MKVEKQHPRLVTATEVVAVLSGGLLAGLMYAAFLYSTQFALLASLYVFVAFQLGRRLGLLDARFLFFVGAIVYSTAGAIDYYVFGDIAGYGEAENARITAVASPFLVIAGAYLLAMARPSIDRGRVDASVARLMAVGVAAVLLILLYILLSVRTFGWSTSLLDRATLTSEQGTAAALIRNFAVACILVLVWVAVHSRVHRLRWIPILALVLGLAGFDLLFFGDRRVILCMLLGVIYLTLNRSRALLWCVPVLAGALVGLLLFAAVREQPLGSWLEVIVDLELFTYLTPTNLDFGGFPLIASDVLSSTRPLLNGAPSYLDSIAATIPSFLYPDRPQAFSVWYVQTFHADVAAIGGGMASNWIMESYVNFGWFGPGLVGGATAWLVNRLCSPRATWPALNNAASVSAFAFIMRYDFTSFLQVLGAITLMAMLLGRLIVSRQAMRSADVNPT